jgi:cell division protein FtsZ
MLFKTGLINLDFSTLKQAFNQRGGKTLFSLGEGAGENAVADTIASLKLCPLLHTPEFSRKADRLLVNILGGADLTLPKVNEIMSAVTDQFGRDSHIIMGAVIDETMAGRVEVCVLGTSDMGGRGVTSRRPAPAVRTKTPAPVPSRGDSPTAHAPANVTRVETPEELPAFPAGRAVDSAESRNLEAAKAAQEEFGFGEVERRGHFEKTDRNLFDGHDLDVPTYLRKGIKISL